MNPNATPALDGIAKAADVPKLRGMFRIHVATLVLSATIIAPFVQSLVAL